MWQMGSGTEILDHRIIVGNLSNQFYEAVAYIKANQRTRYDITGLKRTEIPEFPDEILRELVLNQIIHRDYFEHGADIEIKIFPDRIEFSNPAVLPKGKNPADMLGHSYRRNPLLAETFQRIGLIERAGTGLLRVRQLMERENRLPLLLTHEAMYFIATIERSSTNASSGSSNEFELKISRLLKGRTMSSKEISETLSIPVRTLRGKLSELLQSGKIIQIKEGRKILYSLTGKI
jgi:ATP-dependent DNA helicase RecG